MNKQEIKNEIAKLQAKLVKVDRIEQGDIPNEAQALLMNTQKFSFGVMFERRKELKKVDQPGILFESSRTFTSREEAEHHAKRFVKKHGHVGYDVFRTPKKANAWVNWNTGKTNPAI